MKVKVMRVMMIMMINVDGDVEDDDAVAGDCDDVVMNEFCILDDDDDDEC